MLIDLFAPHNYFTYNIKLAHILGLNASIYLASLLFQYTEDTSTNEFKKINKLKITELTTFTESEQQTFDKVLQKAKIIDIKDKLYKVNIDMVYSLVCSSDETSVKDLSTMLKRTPRTKTDAIKSELKAKITTTNSELRTAYYDWVDSVFAKEGWMSAKAVLVGQQVVDRFSNHNLDIALEVLQIAAVSGYRDVTWATNVYKDRHPAGVDCIRLNTPMKPCEREVKLAKDVF